MAKTLGTYFTEYFRMPYLYRGDLEAIERIVKEDLQPKRFSIAFEGQDYDSVDSIPPQSGVTHVLVLFTQGPDIRLKFANSWTELHAGHTDGQTRKTLDRIAAILRKSERRGLWSLTRFTAWLAPLLCFGVIATIFGLIAGGLLNVRALYGLAVWVALVSVWWGVGYYHSLIGWACINFEVTGSESDLIVKKSSRSKKVF